MSKIRYKASGIVHLTQDEPEIRIPLKFDFEENSVTLVVHAHGHHHHCGGSEQINNVVAYAKEGHTLIIVADIVEGKVRVDWNVYHNE
jgi:hypothetical protein